MKNLLLAIVGVTLMSMQTYAQNVATPTSGTSEAANSDYVTIGSRVPYFVAPDATIQAMTTAGTMKASIFNWTVTTAADAVIAGVPILEYNGTAGQQYNDFRVVTAGTGYYDNEISVEWSAVNGFAAGTQYKVKTAEKSVTLSATVAGCQDATTEEKNVFVLARPTVAFVGTETGGCTVAPGDAVDVPLTVTGLGDWQVTYTVAYNGGAASTPASYTLTLAAPVVTDADVIANSTASRNTAAGTGLVYTLPAAQYGYYDVTITDITDRTSRKSLSALAAAGASGTFRIYVNPVPVTQPIQHIRNL
jgi:hypothetical protein